MKVAIIGAGAAGLYSARLLEKTGHEVVILEAKERIGGRIRTVREVGLVFDAGGEWLDGDHEIALGLCEELGVPLRASKGARWVRYRGERCTTETLWSDAEESAERFESAALDWLNRAPRPTDTLDDVVNDCATTERGAWWLTANYRSDEGDDLDQIGLTGWLRVFCQYAEREGGELSAFSLENGMQSLLDAIAEQLRSPIRLGCRVARVDQGARGVTLTLTNGEAIQADAAIAAAPPWALMQIDWNPAPPTEQWTAWEQCGRARAIKIAFVFDRPWWRDLEWTGSQFCDEPIQQTWDGTRGGTPIMLAYVCGAGAERLMADYAAGEMSDTEFARQLLPQLGDPRAQDHFVEGRVYNWIAEAGGAFSFMPPGYDESHLAHLWQPLGRVQFAGEHASPWMGFIEGAFESTRRCVSHLAN